MLPEFIRDFIQQFEGDVTFSLITPFLSNDYVFPMPIFVTGDNPIPHCFILSKDGEQRRRNMTCLTVEGQGKRNAFLLLEPEHHSKTEVIHLETNADYYDLDVIKAHLYQYLT